MFIWAGLGQDLYAQYVNPAHYGRAQRTSVAPSRKQVFVKNRPVQLINDSMLIDMDIVIDGLSINTERQLVMIPVLATKGYSKGLPPVVINGKNRHKLYMRKLALSGGDKYNPYQIVKASDDDLRQVVNYKMAIPVEPWMHNASFRLEQELCGCAGENQRISVDIIEQQMLVVTEPVFGFDYSNLLVSFIEPPREEIKNLSESDQAYIVFKTGQSVVIENMGNNSQELSKIMSSFDYIIEEPTAKITGIRITAYASPEGSEASNKSLSERRAAALLNWVRKSHDLRGVRRVSSIGKGEDWETLARLVEEDNSLTTEEKSVISSIISSTRSLDEREKAIKAYKGGVPYRHIFNDIYPTLRRSDYRIEFSVPEFTLEKSIEMLKTKPGMLSQAEYYAIANTFSKGSKDFNRIFDIAVRLFPDDPIAALNAAAAELEAEELGKAEQRLKAFRDDPRAWNNIAVLLIRKQKIDEAEAILKKAAERGDKDAGHNLKLIPQLKEAIGKYNEELERYNFFKGAANQ